MISKWIAGLFKKPEPEIVVHEKPERPRQIMSTHDFFDDKQKIQNLWDRSFHNAIHPAMDKNLIHTPSGNIVSRGVMDSAVAVQDNQLNMKSAAYANDVIQDAQLSWYLSQGFIGWQTCAILAQNWLIGKCCLMPAEDAVRNGYEISVNDGEDIDAEIRDAMRSFDDEFKISKNLIEFIQMGRVFGIRVAMFKVDSDDPNYYYKPFNIDGVKPGSYKGISQIDPYWLAYNFSDEAASDPSAIDFYEPTWWIIGNKKIHKSHLIIYITEEVADILKPQYRYGGIPVPQKILERVYAAERTANEAPLLALTKRTDVIKVDLPQVAANPQSFYQRIQQWVYNRDNFGVKALGLDEEMQQFDTSLADLDAVIMTQYQLVAAESNVPAVKLIGTSPKGFNTTGEYEEASYHEMLESLQEKALTPFLVRHYQLLIMSEIVPKFGNKNFDFKIVWESLDAMTAKEQAELNKLKADTGTVLMMSGAISPEEERDRLIADQESGYNGLAAGEVFTPESEDDEEEL